MAGEAFKTAVDTTALAAAHRRLVADGQVQLDLPLYRPPEPPSWLQPLIKWLTAHGPVVQFVFWAGLAVVAVLLLWGLYAWLAPIVRARLGRMPADPATDQWRPEAEPARALLAEADALAAGGAFAEAAHLLLLRSVEEIEVRFPGRLRPSSTSREIAGVAILPPDTARAFGLIARVVETGIFARRPVGAAAWTQCREAYAAAAFGTPA